LRLTLQITITLLVLSACSDKPSDNQQDVVAKVGEKVLTESEIIRQYHKTEMSMDSASFVKDYKAEWIREQVLLEKAHNMLTEQERDKSELVSQYYNDLLIYELEKKFLEQELDTAVSEEALRAYYDNNLKNFELKENIVRLRFFSLPPDLPNQKKLWNKFKTGEKKYLETLERLCDLSETNYFYNDSLWLSFNDLLKEVPITTYNQESYLNNHRFIRLEEKDYSYFVEILDFRIRNSTSPYEFEKPRIKNILLHKRKVELLQQIEDEIVEEAYRDLKVKTY